ncbi:hypothetical protein [Streptomyces sp. URMC 123]|uniref:hypothetical protein n=1 Tax=Streptomyces sp. URMC 123 TaxID=3423403 RepID=UPI003F1C20B4
MASRFSSDPQVAAQVAGELARLREDMRVAARRLDTANVTDSVAINTALDAFHHAAAQSWDSLLAEIGQAADLFAQLSRGTLDLDKAFADKARTI